MEELARQIQSDVDAYNHPDSVSWADSRFHTGSRQAGDALVPSLQWHVDRQILLNDDRADVSGGMLAELAATVLALEAMSRLERRMVLDVVKLTRAAVEVAGKGRRPVGGCPATSNMTSLLAAALRHSSRVAAGRLGSGGLGVSLLCGSAKRSRLLPEVCDDFSCAGCKLSPRDRAITSEMHETVLLGIYWRLAALVVLGHVKKSGVPVIASCSTAGCLNS